MLQPLCFSLLLSWHGTPYEIVLQLPFSLSSFTRWSGCHSHLPSLSKCQGFSGIQIILFSFCLCSKTSSRVMFFLAQLLSSEADWLLHHFPSVQQNGLSSTVDHWKKNTDSRRRAFKMLLFFSRSPFADPLEVTHRTLPTFISPIPIWLYGLLHTWTKVPD